MKETLITNVICFLPSSGEDISYISRQHFIGVIHSCIMAFTIITILLVKVVIDITELEA